MCFGENRSLPFISSRYGTPTIFVGKQLFYIKFFPDKYKDDLLKLGTISGRDDSRKINKTVLTAIPLRNHTVGFSQAEKIYISKKWIS